MNSKTPIFWAVEGVVNPKLDSGVYQSFEFLRMRYSKFGPDHILITFHESAEAAYQHLKSKGIFL